MADPTDTARTQHQMLPLPSSRMHTAPPDTHVQCCKWSQLLHSHYLQNVGQEGLNMPSWLICSLPTATQSSIPTWRIPWIEETGRLQSMGSQRVDMTEQLTLTHMKTSYIPKGPVSYLNSLSSLLITTRFWPRNLTCIWQSKNHSGIPHLFSPLCSGPFVSSGK